LTSVPKELPASPIAFLLTWAHTGHCSMVKWEVSKIRF